MFADRLNKTALADLGGISFKCSCGNRHSVSVKDVVLRDDALSLLPFFLKKTTRGCVKMANFGSALSVCQY